MRVYEELFIVRPDITDEEIDRGLDLLKASLDAAAAERK